MSNTPNLDIPLVETQQLQPEVTMNSGILAFERAITESAEIECVDGINTVTSAEAREHLHLLLVDGSPATSAAFTVQLPAVKRLLAVTNGTEYAALLVCVDAATGAAEATVRAGESGLVYCDATQVTLITADVTELSLFTSLTDTPSSYSGAARKAVVVNSGATALEFVDVPYDVGTFCAGKPSSSEILLRMVAVRAFTLPASLSGSQVRSGTAAAATTDFDVQKNGSSIGTISFSASGSTATYTFASDVSFAAGDILAIIAPASADATLADISFTLAGTRT